MFSMNRWLICFFLSVVGGATFAQDFTDTRRQTESFVRLRQPEIRADVAHFAFKGISESANAPVLNKVSPTAVTKDSLVIEGHGIYAKVLLESFDPNAHKLTYDEKTLTRIDRRTYYGNYGSVPKTSISNILLIINGDTTVIPPSAYSDLHNMNFAYVDKGVERTRDAVFVSKDGNRVYLYLFSSDNKGSYEVTFIISDGKYYRRVLDYGFL